MRPPVVQPLIFLLALGIIRGDALLIVVFFIVIVLVFILFSYLILLRGRIFNVVELLAFDTV